MKWLIAAGGFHPSGVRGSADGGFAVPNSGDERFQWRKSTKSSFGACVEVRITDDAVAVRNSRDRGGPVLRFTAAEWTAFLAGAAEHEFDLP